MRNTEVLLREHVKNLGRCGDIVRVAPGFARNYLIPRGIGIAATEDNKKAMERRRERLDIEEAALLAEIDSRLAAFAKLELETEQRADDHGHLYGSVNDAMVVSLMAGKGHTIEEKDVRMGKPIKSVGIHQVQIHLHAERSGEITLKVLPEGGELPVAEPAVKAEGEETPAEETPAE
jgi:large subunit ribosomal protein L9